MNEPLLSTTRDPFFDLEGVGSRCAGELPNLSTSSRTSKQQSGSFSSIPKKYLNLFLPYHLNLEALRWTDCHFEGKENVIAVFDTDYESLESFYAEMLIRYQKVTGVVILLMLFNIFYSAKTLVKFRQLGYTIPKEVICMKLLHIFYIIVLVFIMRRIRRNQKLELVRHIALTTEGVHIETNQSYAGLIYRKKNISVTKIAYDDIVICKYDYIIPGYRRKRIGEIYSKMGKTLQLKMSGVCHRRNIEGIIHGDVMAQMIICLRDSKS